MITKNIKFNTLKNVSRNGTAIRKTNRLFGRFKSTLSSTMVENEVKLKHVPSLPFFGSLIPQYSNIPTYSTRKCYEYYPAIRKEYGDFVTMGFPGIGNGLHGTMYVVTRPEEMLKILHREGKYPSGAVEGEWPIRKYFEETNSSLAGLFSHGEEWKRLRSFLQTDLLSPVAAKAHVPGMLKAAKCASQGATTHNDNLTMKEYLSRCSFDLFSSVMFGELTLSAKNPGLDNTSSSSDSGTLCKSTFQLTDDLFSMMISPFELILSKIGIESARYKSLYANTRASEEMAMKKIEAFKERKLQGTLNEFEKASYFARAMDRQLGSDITEKEMKELSTVLIIAAVDTTSSSLHWILVQLALNQDVQQKLYSMLKSAVAKNGGNLSVDLLSKKAIPYLHAIIRETHRLTPAIPISIVKSNSSEVEIHGEKLAPGCIFVFNSQALGLDPNIVPNPDKFDPTRWSDDAVKERKGTKSEVIDHPLLRDPFSHGARKCPGSRIASYEVLVMISQLVLDHHISISDEHVKSLKDVAHEQQLTVHPDPLNFKFSARD